MPCSTQSSPLSSTQTRALAPSALLRTPYPPVSSRTWTSSTPRQCTYRTLVFLHVYSLLFLYSFPLKTTKALANVHIASSHRHNSTAHTRRAGVDASCDNAMTPACLQALYNVPTTPATQSSNTLAVSSFVSSSSSTADLTNFLGQFRSDIPASTTFAVSNLDGGVNDEAQTSVEGVR